MRANRPGAGRGLAGALREKYPRWQLAIAAFDVHPQWRAVLRATAIPQMPRGRDAWATLVAILGTTISPYLFFWQASQEVEEEKKAGQLTLKARQGATATQIGDRKIDIGFGTLFSNVAMFFIIVTTASTLHAHGQTHLESSADVAAALKPLAGPFAMLLYTIGIVGTGLLAPFLMIGILHAASDRKLMNGQPSSMLGRVVVGVTTIAMLGAGIAMFVV